MNLLVAALLLVQAKSPAEEELAKIEETIAGAKSLSVKIKITITKGEGAKEEKQTAEGLLLLKEEKKIYSAFDSKFQDQDQRITVVSDGEYLQGRAKGLDHVLEAPALPRFRKFFECSFIRGGGVGAMSLTAIYCGLVHAARKMEQDPAKFIAVGDFEQGKDAAGPFLTFTSKMDHFGPKMKITLWYDPASHKPLKSSIQGQDVGRITEVYEDLVLNGEIPDEKFKLPKEEPSLEEKLADAKGTMSMVAAALGMYELDNGMYPSSEQGLSALLTKPKDAKGWKGPYLESVPLDPWGKAYVYRFPLKSNPHAFELLSSGPDGKEGTDDDINFGKPTPPKQKK